MVLSLLFASNGFACVMRRSKFATVTAISNTIALFSESSIPSEKPASCGSLYGFPADSLHLSVSGAKVDPVGAVRFQLSTFPVEAGTPVDNRHLHFAEIL
jgi:hypothetical protein